MKNISKFLVKYRLYILFAIATLGLFLMLDTWEDIKEGVILLSGMISGSLIFKAVDNYKKEA